MVHMRAVLLLLHSQLYLWVPPPLVRFLHIEGFRPEWWISSMIYSRDTPFWSGTLDMWPLYNPTITVATLSLRGWHESSDYLEKRFSLSWVLVIDLLFPVQEGLLLNDLLVIQVYKESQQHACNTNNYVTTISTARKLKSPQIFFLLHNSNYNQFRSSLLLIIWPLQLNEILTAIILQAS